jgi:hypothetical protein
MQIEFTSEALEQMDALVEVVGASSRAEVVRRALDMYKQFCHEVGVGSRTFFVDLSGKEPAVLLPTASRPRPYEDQVQQSKEREVLLQQVLDSTLPDSEKAARLQGLLPSFRAGESVMAGDLKVLVESIRFLLEGLR